MLSNEKSGHGRKSVPAFVVVVLALVVVITATPAMGASAVVGAHGDICMISAAVLDPNMHHISEVADGTIQFGTNLTVRTDCPGGFNLTVLERGVVVERVNAPGGLYMIPMGPATDQLIIDGDGWTLNYTGLVFYPSFMLEQVMTSLEPVEYQGDSIPVANLRAHQSVIAVVSVAIAWVASVLVLDRVAEWRTSRTLIEEVME